MSRLFLKENFHNDIEHYVFGDDDLIPDVIPDEKKPLEPPEEIEDDEFDDDDYDEILL